MPLTVEDASGLEAADSYVTLAHYQSYAAARGWGAADESQDEINLRKAFDALNRLWSFTGEKVTEAQAGAFPRTDRDGVPTDVKLAQIELAHRIAGGLDPFATQEQSVTRSKRKVGPIETETETLPTGSPRLVAVEALLGPFLAAGAGQIRLVRG
jgi:hypothetical protein